jgi:hypothetical protein
MQLAVEGRRMCLIGSETLRIGLWQPNVRNSRFFLFARPVTAWSARTDCQFEETTESAKRDRRKSE